MAGEGGTPECLEVAPPRIPGTPAPTFPREWFHLKQVQDVGESSSTINNNQELTELYKDPEHQSSGKKQKTKEIKTLVKKKKTNTCFKVTSEKQS